MIFTVENAFLHNLDARVIIFADHSTHICNASLSFFI